MRKIYPQFLGVLILLFSGVIASGQLTGTKTIPGDYATIELAVADLNTQGVGAGGVVFNIAAGYTETLTSRINVTATGTSANPIIFQKSGSGANPVIAAYAGGTGTPGSAIPDGIWSFQGSDYVTIDGIDLSENAANTANPATMEYGFGFFKNSVTDGAQNNTVRNCRITLNRANNASGSGPMVEGSVGILLVNSLPTAASTTLTPTSADGANSNNRFYANHIENCNYGIALSGYAAPSPFTLGDTNNDIGGNSPATGNTILNYGGTAGSTNPAAGIRANQQWGVNISFNTVNNNDGSGANHPTTLRGIYAQTGTSASATINNNKVTVTSGATTSACTAIENSIGSTASSNTIEINNNLVQNCSYPTATTGTLTGILNGASAANVNINGNKIDNCTVGSSGTTNSCTFQGIYSSASATNLSFSNDTVTNCKVNNGGGTMYCLRASTSMYTVTGNVINNNGFPFSGGTTSSSLYGFYDLTSPTSETITNNRIDNLTVTSSSTSSSSLIAGIHTNTAAGSKTWSDNIIHSLIFTNSSTGSATVNGISSALSTTINVFRNRVYNLSAEGPTSLVNGILFSSTSTNGVVTLYNNLVGGLNAPTADNGTTDNVRGISITATSTGSTFNVYYNTIYLDAVSSGTNFTSTGFYHAGNTTGTNANLTLKNNIIVNKSTPTGTGYAIAYRRSNANSNNYNPLSDNNLFYAGTPSATNLIFYDGTNSFGTLPDYKTFISGVGADQGSLTENLAVQSTTGSSADFLKFNTSATSLAESGAQNVTGITEDYAGTVRQGNTGYTGTGTQPDIGAWELEGIGVSCTGTPAASNAVASTNTPCAGQSLTLSLDQTYLGVTYQWQTSTDNVSYVNITDANSSSLIITTPASSTWYRAIISCGTNDRTSGAVQVVVEPGMAGLYTINSGAGTSGTNFASFADAVNALVCRGVVAPVTFDVVSGSGPYNEQVVIPEIPGASEVNTITFYGNDAVIQASPVTGTRYLVRLDGADHIILKRLNLVVQAGATFGWGIHLTNGADYNTVDSCTIDISVVTNTTQSNSGGIVASGSSTSVTTDGSASYNTFSSNTVIGGYQGFIINGATGALNAVNNKIINNTIRDFYATGIELTDNDSCIVSGNDIHRMNRSTGGTATTVVGTFAGVELGSGNKNCIVEANRIHDTHTSAGTDQGDAAYGVFATGDDAPAGSENRVINNLIYNFNALTGIQYGLYNSSSDSIFYYHNTVVLDNAASTSGTTRGFYQTTTATGIDVKNNIFFIGRGGTGVKYALFLNTTTSTITSDNNIFYITSTTGTNGIGSISTTGYATLVDWKAANGGTYDQASLEADPIFTNPGSGEYKPSNSALANAGAQVGVEFDIEGTSRTLATPDPGAYEFSIPTVGVNMAAEALVAPAVADFGCYTAAENVVIRIRNNSQSAIAFNVNPVTVTVNVSGAATQTLSVILNSGSLAAGDTMNVLLPGTVNMSVDGTYLFDAFTSVLNDVDPSNDAMLTANRTKVLLEPGTIAASPISFCVTPGTPTLSTTGANGFSMLQWQHSTTSGTGFTDIAGGTTNPFTVGTAVAQTMYYRLQAGCGGNFVNSSEFSVEFNDPQLLSSTGGTRCGPGQVTLSASAATGTNLNWYDAPTGGSPIGSGTTFTTPVISATTDFYVSAGTGLGVVSAGRTTPFATSTGFSGNDYGLVFDATQAFTLVSVDVYPTSSAGLLTVQLEDGSGTVIQTAGPFNIPAGTGTTFGGGATPHTLTLNFNVPVGTGFRLQSAAHSASIVRDNPIGSNFSYPLPIGPVGNITSGLLSGAANANTYYYFYNWQVTAGCESPRTAVTATITTPPAISASATSVTICLGQSTQLNVTSGNTGYGYSWNPGGLTGASQTVSPSSNTTYTVTATDNSGGPNDGCVNTADVSVTVNPLPGAVTVTPPSVTICTGGDAQLLAASGGFDQKQLDFGTQAAQNSASGLAAGYPAPYTVYYGGQRMQMLITQAEMLAAGFSAGAVITNVQFPVVSLGSNWGGSMTACQNFQMSIGATSLTSLSAFQTGLTQVVAPAPFTPAVGYGNTHSFNTPFIWDGTSNLIIETTFSNDITGTTNDLVVQYNSPTSFQSTIVYRADGVTAAAAASATTINFSYNARPDFRLNGGSPASFTWTPTTGLFTDAAGTIAYTGGSAASVYAKPPATETFTATSTGANGCSSSNTSTVIIGPPPSATISYDASPYCADGSTAAVTLTGSTGGVYSSTAGLSIDAGTGAITLNSSTPGTYTVTYTIAATSGCPQFQTTTSITINPPPSATIQYTGSPYCSGAGAASVTLTGSTGGTYSSTAGLVINAATGEIDLGASTVGTYTVTYTVPAANGCLQYEFTTPVTITNAPTATISYSGSPYCSNAITATVTRTGAVGGTYSSTTGLIIDANSGDVDLSGSTPGTYTVTYTVPAASGCPGVVTTANITITQAPAATISYAPTPYCTNAGTATPVLTGTAGGTYTSTAGLSLNASTGEVNLAASTAGTYTVTYTIAAANGCAQIQATTNISIVAAPSAAISYAGSPYCGNGISASVTRTGAAGGTYSSTTGLVINASTGTVTLNASTPGTYTVTYTVPSPSGCADFVTTTVIEITTPPSASISYAGSPYCSGAGTATVTHSGSTGGTYSSTNGISINAATGEVDLGASTPGTYLVTYTIPAGNGCAVYTATTGITISSQPSATISYAGSPYCSNGATAAVTRTGTPGGTYSSTAGLSINTTTGAINLSASTAGTYTVTYTIAAAGACPGFSTTASVTVTTAPSATISYAGSPYCSNGGTATVTHTGTGGGTYSSTTGLSINSTSGAIDLAGSTPGTYAVTYTVSPSGGCDIYTTTASVTVSAAPAATISYPGSPYCGSTGIAVVTHTGSPGGVYSSTTGLVINPASGAVDIGASTPGTYTVTYTVAAAAGCASYSATTTILLTTPGTWTGLVSTDWNNPANWCGGIPSGATDAIIPASAANMPNLSNGTGSVRNIVMGTGATLTIGTAGVLELFGNITGGALNAGSGSITLRGSSNQTLPAFTAANLTMNMSGAGSSLVLGGHSGVTGTLTLTNGNILLGANNFSMGGGANGKVTSHIVTNATGNLIVTNLAASQNRTIPIGSDAVSYNPVALTANPGHAADDFVVRVQEGVFENGATGARAQTHVADRSWIINEGTAGGSNVTIALQWSAAQELADFNRSKSYISQHSGAGWVDGTVASALGNDPYTQTKANLSTFGVFAVRTQPIPRPVTGIYPNPTTSQLNVVTDLLSDGPVVFSVYDDKGMLVYRKQESLTVGLNLTTLDISHLSAGVYFLKVTTRINDQFLNQRFIKMN